MLGLHRCLGFSLIAVSGGYSVVSVTRLLIAAASSVEEHDLGHAGFSSWGSRAQAQYLWHTDVAALWHVGSSLYRDGARVSCIGRRILYC